MAWLHKSKRPAGFGGIGDRGSGIGDRGSQRDRRSGDRRSRRDRRSEDRGSRRDRRSRIFQTCNREMSHPKATQVPQNSWGIAEGSEGSQRDRRSEDRGSQRDRRSEDRRSRFRDRRSGIVDRRSGIGDRRSATNRRALFRVDLCNHARNSGLALENHDFSFNLS